MKPPTKEESYEIAKSLLGDSSYDNFSAFFARYHEVFCPSYSHDAITNIDRPLVNSHREVLRLVHALKENPLLTRDEFAELAIPESDATTAEKSWLGKAVASVAFMINCASKDSYSSGFQYYEDTTRVTWERDQAFADFVEQSFRTNTARSPEQEARNRLAISHRKSLKAWKLAKRNKITLRRTDSLIEHLRYDPRTRILHVFHHTMWLQAQLKRSKDAAFEMGFQESISMGTLPPTLLLETLVTIHCILFPLVNMGNKRSIKAMRKLIRDEGFDPEATWVEFVRPIPHDFPFVYWGSRLAELYSVVKDPPPINPLVSWVERHASERNALAVAMLGLFLAVLFGLLSLITGVLQLIIAWLAWKHPVVSAV